MRIMPIIKKLVNSNKISKKMPTVSSHKNPKYDINYIIKKGTEKFRQEFNEQNVGFKLSQPKSTDKEIHHKVLIERILDKILNKKNNK